MSIKITANQVNLDRQYVDGVSQTQDQVGVGGVVDESRFILMKGNQLSALSKLGLSGDVLREIAITSDEDCGGEGCCPSLKECDAYVCCPGECSLDG